MSLDTTARRIVCDNSECGEDVSLPIALRPGAADASLSGRSPAAGWVFVTGSYEDRHYCPQCADKLLPLRRA